MHRMTKMTGLLLVMSALLFGQQYPGFRVQGRFLYDRFGEKVILRGANAMIAFWDRSGVVNYPELSKTGANCCRIFWRTGHEPEPVLPARDLDRTLTNCIKNKMIPVICLWDATGDWRKLQTCVDYWVRPDVSGVLKKHEKYLLLNIANEAGSKDMGKTEYRNRYTEAILQLRDAGLHMPLIIDADRWGRNGSALLDNGPYLLDQDPDHNLIFSWHLWDPRHWGMGSRNSIQNLIDGAMEKNICFIVGEFGPCEQCDRCQETLIEWQYLIEYCHKNQIGWLAWVWNWRGCHSIVNNKTGLFGDWNPGSWGELLAVDSPYGIQKTASRPDWLETVILDDRALVNLFKLEQNYPNPFNTQTFIHYNLPLETVLSLRIYDIRGRFVAELCDGIYPAGAYTDRWDGTSYNGGPAASGMYIVRINARFAGQSTVEQKKMILLR